MPQSSATSSVHQAHEPKDLLEEEPLVGAVLWRPFHGIVFWSILVLGACIRLSQYFQRRSLYIDEATLALSIASRPFLGLLRPLDYDQLSPVPFLWAVRAVTMVAGVDELTLRGVSLVSGLVLLLVLGRIARRLFPAEVTLWIVALAALNPSLIHYSNELKPYILDALVAAALILWALDVLR
ncbi:MAG: glycosyltransferase family 39 protein, partial [Acidimicrobiia bacterium]